jgi:hypothetical protein
VLHHLDVQRRCERPAHDLLFQLVSFPSFPFPMVFFSILATEGKVLCPVYCTINTMHFSYLSLSPLPSRVQKIHFSQLKSHSGHFVLHNPSESLLVSRFQRVPPLNAHNTGRGSPPSEARASLHSCFSSALHVSYGLALTIPSICLVDIVLVRTSARRRGS